MLSKNEIAQEIEAMTGTKRNLVKTVLDALTDLACDEISDGNDFTVPGIARITYTYRAPQKKGARWTKGTERVGFGGVAVVADSDSPPVKEQIKLKSIPTGPVARLKPGSRPEAQSAFLKTAAAKAVRKRKAK